MKLLELQFAFSQMIVDLIRYAHIMGYNVTLGEAWRSPETAALYAKKGIGSKNSLHCQRLAFDLNLFDRNKKYLTKTEDYKFLGEFWESLARREIKTCWGGRFRDARGRPKPDGNHFSVEWQGRK